MLRLKIRGYIIFIAQTINNQESDVWISSLKEKHTRSEAASQEVIGQKEIK